MSTVCNCILSRVQFLMCLFIPNELRSKLRIFTYQILIAFYCLPSLGGSTSLRSITRSPVGLAGEGGEALGPSAFLFAGPVWISHVGSDLGNSLFFNLNLRDPH